MINEKILYDYCDTSWFDFLNTLEEKTKYLHMLQTIIENHHKGYTICPPLHHIFRAYTLPLQDIKVILLGQDPYHSPHLAEGWAFSVPKNHKIPPSLRNIFKELQQDMKIPSPKHGHLSAWVEQGVFLLNTSLTTQQGTAHAHSTLGWRDFTQKTVKYISHHQTYCVFLLWGGYARSYIPCIDQKKHCILTSAHPSPLSAYRGFLGNKHFSLCNAYLIQHGKVPIDWRIPD